MSSFGGPNIKKHNLRKVVVLVSNYSVNYDSIKLGLCKNLLPPYLMEDAKSTLISLGLYLTLSPNSDLVQTGTYK